NYERRAILEATAKHIAQERGDNLGLNMLQTSIFSSGAPAQHIFRTYLRQRLDEVNLQERARAVPVAADNTPSTYFRDKVKQRQDERSVDNTLAV
ncbi:MAG: hypothetical protein K2Q01_06675, partial [Rickettsiales bacterium]|nr:hypothetical protein [Rickettsiales bacterium]